MKNVICQTDERLVDAGCQTDTLQTLKPISSLFAKSVDEGETEEEEEENVGTFQQQKRSNTFSGGLNHNHRLEKAGKKRGGGGGIGQKQRLYIYNTGD